ncbi:aldo/keto reductase [filamentous cyanobacterium LEGE 11480]|uniref:Aldo/keto reductase n=1 Tax=Romeriopsis navalis LEGE 11480 TaxID=2777977 RepID=A0A928VQL7_9CYAN|nr:aldo/keto reductase [Romeriopsis navalis]MBE9030805.1 aldo/keto reductase [Romeriopsis navalis LEGE 11480]
MLYRRFGRTELQMPVFSCGGMRYQHKWQDVPLSEIPAANQRNLEATIHRSFELGINHIETARAYGTSELQLGQVLPQLPRDQLIIQTKVVVKETPQAFLETFEQSLKLLQLDYVDLLSVHGINLDEHLESCMAPGGLLDVIRKLQAQGKVRFVGFSTHGPTDVIVRAVETNQFDYVNVHWYYINQLNWPVVEAATARDMGVFIISPSDKGGHLHTPPPKLVELCQPLSPMVFNNLFCLSHSQVHTLSLGAARPSDFDEHLKTLELIDLADEILPPILTRLEQAGMAALGEDWWKNWRTGLPEPEETPDRLNIPLILWLRNLALAYDMTDYAQARYNLLGGAASHWFPGSRAERVNDGELRSLLQNSPFAEQIPHLLRDAHRILGGAAVKRLSQSD